MWWLILITLLQAFLLVELGLLFLKVLGNAKRSNCLGKSCTLVQSGYLFSCRMVGGLFMVLAALVIMVSTFELAGTIKTLFWH